MSAPVPPWVLSDAWRPLNPPAEIRKLGEPPRSPEKLLAITRALCVTIALRYQPDASGTKCNILTSDVLDIMRAPIRHWYDPDGDGPAPAHETTANEIVDNLHALKYPGWSKVGTVASSKAVVELASMGKPTIATWKNTTPRKDSAGRVLTQSGKVLYRPGHVVIVVPTPKGKTGVYVTGAGAHCIEECPIEFAFGQYLPEVEFFSHYE